MTATHTQSPTQPGGASANKPHDSRAGKPADAGDGQTIIKCAGLGKVFRDFWLRNRVQAVDNVNLSVCEGEVFGLLGPNGSGKSTTVKMILGLLHPTAGRIAVFGHHPSDVKIKKNLGYLPEESYLYPFLNARETLDYYGKLFHQNRRQRTQRIDMLLEMVGLDKVARRPIGEYSKGMQRRIGLAQALINDPQVLILDEPTTGLDPIGTRQIKDLIRQLAERGKTVLLCSHLLADVEDVTDRVSIMFGGKVRQEGTIDQLLTQSGVTSIEASDLSESDVEAIDQALVQRNKHIDRVAHPREKLESLFMQIVHDAQREGAATSGAGSGGPIAEFLVDKESAHMPEGRDPGQVLSQLMSDEGEGEGQGKGRGEPGDAADGEARGAVAGRSADHTRDADEPGAARSPVTGDTVSPDSAGAGSSSEQSTADTSAETDRGVLDQLTGESEQRESQPDTAAAASTASESDAADFNAPDASDQPQASASASDQRPASGSDTTHREPGRADDDNADQSVIDSLVNPAGSEQAPPRDDDEQQNDH